MNSPMKNRPRPALYRGEVLRTEQLTPHMVRVVLGGDGLTDFQCGDYTDHYVKLIFRHPDAPGLDLETFNPATTDLPRDVWPVTRTYTIRSWSAERYELTIDFVTHGDSGLAGPWAANAQVGEEMWLRGPGGSYRPDITADWHLFIGDDSALPAIAAAWEQIPEDHTAHAIVEVPGQDGVVPLPISRTKTVDWIFRDNAPAGVPLVRAVEQLSQRKGRGQAFVHGEAQAVKAIRRLLFVNWQMPKQDVSISGYWRTGNTEDQWQAGKKAWLAEVERDESQLLHSTQSPSDT